MNRYHRVFAIKAFSHAARPSCAINPPQAVPRGQSRRLVRRAALMRKDSKALRGRQVNKMPPQPRGSSRPRPPSI